MKCLISWLHIKKLSARKVLLSGTLLNIQKYKNFGEDSFSLIASIPMTIDLSWNGTRRNSKCNSPLHITTPKNSTECMYTNIYLVYSLAE